MTVASNNSRQAYTGNGATTVYAFSYPFLAATDLQVYVAGVLKTLTTDYTVSGTAPYPSGANVTFLSAPANGAAILIVRVVPYTQTLDIVENDPLPAASLEQRLDANVMMTQQIYEIIQRCIQIPVTDIVGTTTTIPVAATRASTTLGFDSVGNVATGSITSTLVAAAMIPVVQAATLALARTAMGVQAAGSYAASGANSDITSLTGLTTALSLPQDFRLTLTTAVPVTTADVTGATTIFCTPYRGNIIALYNGATWQNYTSAEFSLALGSLTSNKPYDVFCYANSGVPTLEFLAWTSDTARATALAYQNGILVKSGTPTRRYLGTFYTTSTTQTEDSLVKRFLWNYYNRVARPMTRRESTASWTYTTATVRQANANTANQLDFVRGVDEDAVTANLVVYAQQGAANNFASGLGLDSITAINAGQGSMGFSGNPPGTACYAGFPGLGRHYLAWLETSVASSTTTWSGNITAAGTTVYSGLSGVVLA